MANTQTELETQIMERQDVPRNSLHLAFMQQCRLKIQQKFIIISFFLNYPKNTI